MKLVIQTLPEPSMAMPRGPLTPSARVAGGGVIGCAAVGEG